MGRAKADDDVINITAGATKIRNMKAAKLMQTESGEIHLNICWQKWNVVEGPLNTHRTGDPGEKFDEFVYGLPDKDRGRMADLKTLHAAMEAYVDKAGKARKQVWEARSKGKSPILTSASTRSDLFDAFMDKHKKAGLVMFRLEMWETLTPGSLVAGGLSRLGERRRRSAPRRPVFTSS